MQDIFVSRKKDSWLQEKYEFESYWKVLLSNDETIFQDDDRPGVEPNSAWIRLAKYLCANDLYITEMTLHYRSIRRLVGRNADGYYFVKSAYGGLSSETRHYYVAGTLKNDILLVKRWTTPSLVLDYKEKRDPSKAGECLIVNPQN